MTDAVKAQVFIREAVQADVLDILCMALKFIATTGYSQTMAVNEGQITTLIKNLLNADDATVWLAEGASGVEGMLGIAIYDHPITGERIASEVCWWVDPAHRRSRIGSLLVTAAEKWAKVRVARMQLTAPDDAIGQFYERRGYQKIETMYLKEL